MEADLRFLIAGLAFNGETVVAAAFLDGSHLSGNLAILRKLGLTFVGNEERFAEIADSQTRFEESGISSFMACGHRAISEKKTDSRPLRIYAPSRKIRKADDCGPTG